LPHRPIAAVSSVRASSAWPRRVSNSPRTLGSRCEPGRRHEGRRPGPMPGGQPGRVGRVDSGICARGRHDPLIRMFATIENLPCAPWGHCGP
jgi:hypothetical protein